MPPALPPPKLGCGPSPSLIKPQLRRRPQALLRKEGSCYSKKGRGAK